MRNAWIKAAPLAVIALLALVGTAGAESAKITVKAAEPGAKISPMLYGIFFEEINRAGDGGIYAEMIENRSFEDNEVMAANNGRPRNGGATPAEGVYAWKAEGLKIALDKSQPLNANNTTALKVAVDGKGAISNAGFRGVGLNLRQEATYLLSLYARSEGVASISARLESKEGEALLGETKIEGIGKEWKKFEVEINCKGTDPNGQLALHVEGKGTLCLDMVSLFPKDTWKGRKNGFRKDLVQALRDMKPSFVRFPGGCFVEGPSLEKAARWKKTIGPIEARASHWNIWGYTSTNGLGFHEYMQLCEDLSAEALFVINCGMSHEEQRGTKPGPQGEALQEYIQDALDAIEYCNGPVESKWGALRAQAGHPEPFGLKFMEIGNENGGTLYQKNYALFYKAIKEKYPQMHLVCDVWNGNDSLLAQAEIVDEHYYNTPEFFMTQAHKYDSYDRSGRKVYVGEYAVTRNVGKGNLHGALGEAAFMTGMERNGDVVAMASYAPLFVNKDWYEWPVNLIVFDQSRVFGIPSYHAQAMFSNNRADVNLPLTLESSKTPAKSLKGRVGVGTWNTQAEFKDIVVTGKDGTVMFKSDEKTKLPARGVIGQWTVENSVLRQTGNAQGAKVLFGRPEWTDYTLELKARKTGGAEGFLITFGSTRDQDKSWWNLGGWGNARHGLEVGKANAETRGRIEAGRWYDIKIENLDGKIRCFLDGKLIHDVSNEGLDSLYAVAGLKTDSEEVILKVVNTSEAKQVTEISIPGAGKLAPEGQALVLAGNFEDENTMEQPTKVVPKALAVGGVAEKFEYTFPPYSITVLRLKKAQ